MEISERIKPKNVRQLPGTVQIFCTVFNANKGTRFTLSHFQNARIALRCPPSLLLHGTGEYFRSSKGTPHLHIVPRLRMSGAIPPPSLYAFIVRTGTIIYFFFFTFNLVRVKKENKELSDFLSTKHPVGPRTMGPKTFFCREYEQKP